MKTAMRVSANAVLMSILCIGSISLAAADPACCAVTSIAKNGQITAQETRGARMFQFQVANPALRSKLSVGAPVYANFNTKQVSLDGKRPCCTILKISKTAKQPVPVTTAGPPSPEAGLESTGSVVQAAPQTQVFNSDVLALHTTSDLVTKDLGFTSLGEIAFNLVNRGEVGINYVPPRHGAATTMGAQPPSSGPPISIDIWMGTSKITVQQRSMGGKQTKHLKVPIPSNYSKPRCLEMRNLKVVIDPQNQIKELHDDNNVTEATNSARPCPDLAIVSIKRDYSGLMKETYSPKVTIINKGNAPSPPNQVWATSMPGGIWGGWPTLVPTHTIPALAPGETTSFHTGGSVLATHPTAVRIVLDRYSQIEESDESNNFKDEGL